MVYFNGGETRSVVALLAEGVDRNTDNEEDASDDLQSPSSRRAWIEIHFLDVPGSRKKRRRPRGGRG